MSGSCRKGGNYGGLNALDTILNGIINECENRINEVKSPSQIRYLEHSRNLKIIEKVKENALRDLLKTK